MVNVYAAVVPPESTRQSLASVVRNVRIPAEGGPGRHKGALRRTLLGRRKGADDAGQAAVGMLTPVEAEDLAIEPIGFGNLSKDDSDRLIDLLTEAAREWPQPRLQVKGGVALDWEGDDGVWATLEGDVDALKEIARSIPQVVQRLNLYVDRRRFRPLVRLGTITDDTSVPYLEALLEDLSGFEGATWVQKTLPIWQLSSGADSQRKLKPITEIPLGS
jgi:hypothetical protein